MDQSTQFRGVARVIQSGNTVVELATGMADESTTLACASNVRFQLASVSKQFAAAATLMLVEDAVVSIEDPVGRWIDGCPKAWGTMTVRHLMTHTAGLSTWVDLPEIDLFTRMDAQDEIAIFQRAPLRSEPGSDWYYSSPGYVLLAHIVEQASGASYADFLTRRIFSPLSMTDTFVGNGLGHDRLASGHRGDQPVPSFELDVVGIGAGDIWSTLDDLSRWHGAFGEDQLLATSSREAMFARQTPLDAPLDLGDLSVGWYGYGWFIGTAFGHPLLVHLGDNSGYVSLNAIVPDLDIHLMILSNDEQTDRFGLAHSMLEPLLT